MAVPAAVTTVTLMRSPSASIVPPSAAIASPASRRILHPRTKIISHPRLKRLRRLRRRTFCGKRDAVFGQGGSLARAGISIERFLLHRIQILHVAFGTKSFSAQTGRVAFVIYVSLSMIMRLFFVRQFSGGFQLRMRDHSFFFRRRFLFFQFLFFVLFFSRVPVNAGFGRCIRRCEPAFLRIARRQIVLRVRDMFGQRRHFFVGQVFVTV